MAKDITNLAASVRQRSVRFKIAENAKLDLAKSIKLKLDVGLRMCHKAKHGYAF